MQNDSKGLTQFERIFGRFKTFVEVVAIVWEVFNSIERNLKSLGLFRTLVKDSANS